MDAGQKGKGGQPPLTDASNAAATGAAAGPETRIAVRVRTSDGRTSDDGWIRVAHRPVARRVGGGLLLGLGGTAVGILLLPVPLIHLFGVMFALAAWGLGVKRALTPTTLVGAGGTCPNCGKKGDFYSGFGHQRIRYPISSSCSSCASQVRLEPLPTPGRP